MSLPGAEQIGRSCRFLKALPWWRLRPCPEIVSGELLQHERPPFAAQADEDGLILVYLPDSLPHWTPAKSVQLGQGRRYHAEFWDPITGLGSPLGIITGDASGSWRIPLAPVLQDFVLKLVPAGQAS